MSESSAEYRVMWKGVITGPFPLERLMSDLQAGRLSLMHQVETPSGWVPLSTLVEAQEEARRREVKQQAERLAQAQRQKPAPPPSAPTLQPQTGAPDQRFEALRSRLPAMGAPGGQQDSYPGFPPGPGSSGGYPPPPRPGMMPMNAPPFAGDQARTSGMAVTALVMAILNFVPGLNLISWILALIFGHVALAQIKSDPSLTGQGMARAALIITYTLLAFGVAWGLFLVATDSI